MKKFRWLLWRIGRFLLLLYAGLFFVGYFGADRLIFQPPKATYVGLPGSFQFSADDGTSLTAQYLPNPTARFTLVYFHGNAEDLGELLAFCEMKIVLKRPVWCKASHLNRTPLPTDPKTIGEHLHKKRHALGLTQRQLAEQLGVWLATLNGWEANLHQPTAKARARVVVWLGFDPRPAE